MNVNQAANGSIDVKGNGNAVGNGNSISTIKEQHNHHHNHSNAPQNGDGKNGPEAAAFIVIGGALALTSLSYWFARFATEIYAAQWSLAVAISVFEVFFCGLNLKASDLPGAWRNGVVALLAALMALTISLASSSYYPELIDLASQSTAVNSFWCGLNLTGQQMASQHSLLSTFVITPALLLLVLQTIRGAVFAVIEEEERPDWLVRVIHGQASNAALFFAAALCAFGMFGYSEMGTHFWTAQFTSEITIFCPLRK